MRTTINMDEGLLRVARGLARQRDETLGRVISDYFQRGLRQSAEAPCVAKFATACLCCGGGREAGQSVRIW